MCAALGRDGAAEPFPQTAAQLDFLAKVTIGGKPRYIPLQQTAAAGERRVYEGRVGDGTLRLAATLRPVAGRSALMVKMEKMENATSATLSFGDVWPRVRPLEKPLPPRRHVLAYDPWPYDVWLFADCSRTAPGSRWPPRRSPTSKA